MLLPESDAQQRLTDRQILLVEDQFLIRMDIQCMLEDRGARITTAPDLAAGLRAVAEGEFDVAVLDVDLPDGQVFPIARALADKGVPIVFHSGHDSVNDLAEEFPQAIALTKPAKDTHIVAAVKGQLT